MSASSFLLLHHYNVSDYYSYSSYREYLEANAAAMGSHTAGASPRLSSDKALTAACVGFTAGVSVRGMGGGQRPEGVRRRVSWG